MSLSRKEFICRGIFAFGRDLAESIKNRSSEPDEQKSVEDHGHLLLDNSRCLAQKGGCFACIDHCPQEAVNIALGKGITIDSELCDGCGECVAVCPLNPKALEMKSQEPEQTKPMERRDE